MKDRWLQVRKAGAEVRSWLERHSGVLTLAWIVIVIGLTIWFWLAFKSNGEALRNYALVAAAAIGLPLAFWRSCVAHKQANSQSKQADTAERGHNNERYQKGADMLGSDVMTTRMGGGYALERLAQEHAPEYHVQIMKLLCAFLRHRTRDRGEKAKAESEEPRSDHEAAAQAIGECRRRLAERGLLKDIEGRFRPSLRDVNLSDTILFRANLSGAILFRANLSGANLVRANLSDAHPLDADLSDADLIHANLSDAYLMGANLSGSDLSGADLSGAELSGAKLFHANIASANFDQVKRLSQEQLDTACQDPDGSQPMHLPSQLTWDEDAAIARWREVHGPRVHG